MKCAKVILAAVLAGGLLSAPGFSSPLQPQEAGDEGLPPQFVEVAGDMEFSGRMIARPVQAGAWADQGVADNVAKANIQRARTLIQQQYEIIEYVPQTDEYIFAVPDGATENALARDLMASGVFQYVEPDWIVYPVGCPNDARFGNQWHHNSSHMQSCAGWDLHTGDPTTVVGICDTGLRTTHEEFQEHRQEGYNAASRRWESQGGDISDINGHGTATSGCAAANGNNGRGISGMGWDLGHRMLRVTNSGNGNASMSDLTHAARTSIENGDRVASVSYSGVTSSSVRTTAWYIKSIGGLLCWAAGNSGERLGGNRDADDVIVVGATARGDSRAGFSNWGPYVDLMAPGASVYTTSRGSNASYGTASGTSFSCPLAAGLCALIFSANPDLTPDQVEQILKESCDDLGANGVDDFYGYGRINVLNAMTLAAVDLQFEYPQGLPETLEPAGGTTVRVEVLADGGQPQPGTGMLHYNDGSGWVEIPMNEITNNVYDAVFPSFHCGSVVEFFFSAETTDGDTSQDPAENEPPYQARAALDFEIVFEDDFESGLGWTIQSTDVQDGAWERGDPFSADSSAPADDFDGSGQCYATGLLAGQDLDGGPTRLISPTFDLSGGGDYQIAYARWFYDDTQGDEDRLVVEISNDDGFNWTLVEEVSDFDQGGWEYVQINVGDFVTPSAAVRLRFSVSDNPNDSITEAAVDAVSIVNLTCGQRTVLTGFEVVAGVLLDGDLSDLIDSDNSRVHTRSGFGATVSELHKLEMIVQAATTVDSPSTMDITIESRIDEPVGTGKVALRNWNTGQFVQVGSFPVNDTDGVDEISGIDATDYVSGTGEIDVQIKHIVFVPFIAFTFESFFDQVEVDVN